MAIRNERSEDIGTRMVSDYIKRHGIKIAAISRGTGISYNKLMRSINSSRPLSVDEFLSICMFVGEDPRNFHARPHSQQA